MIRNTKKEGYHGKYYQNGISQTPQVFIDCQVFDQDDELLINWDVREGIFLPEVIDEMFLMFQDLICNFLIDAENWNVEKVTAILNKNIKISKKKYDLPSGLLYSSILEMAELCPEKEAVQDENEIWSFSKLVRKSWFVQNKLQQEGCIPGDLVGIFMPKSNYQIASVLGVLMNGCTYVPIDIQQPKKRINEIIEQAGIKYVLISSCSKIELMFLDVKYIYADKQNNEIITKQIPQVPNSSIAYVIFTSGSTGKPKGVAISHLSALNTIYYVNKMLNISTNDIVFGVSRLSFDLSVYDIFGILSAGGKLFLPDENRIADPSYLFETIVKQKITVWNSVPAIMQMILEYRENEKRTEQFNIRCSLLSGDWIPLTLPERLISACMEKTRVISLGGATEAAIWSIYYEYEYLFDEWKSIPYEEKGTIVSIALNNVKQYLDFYAGHLYESVADKYTKIILDLGYDKIQLIGHCVGGMIAFEVAKNMMDKGVDVIDVSLIDSIPGKYSIEDEVVMELMFLPMVNITYPVLAEYQLNERELYEYMDEKFGKYTGIEQKSKNKVEEYINGLREIEKEERIRLYINSVSKNMPIQMFVYLFDIFKQSTNGAIYKPIPYLGDIRLFIAEDTEKIVFHRSEEVINFWRENCIGDVTVIMIPGNHLTCFTDVNNIQKLVNMITEK